jgi:hypothetical protein
VQRSDLPLAVVRRELGLDQLGLPQYGPLVVREDGQTSLSGGLRLRLALGQGFGVGGAAGLAGSGVASGSCSTSIVNLARVGADVNFLHFS